MKNVFILSALGLSLLASANVTAADNFPRDSRYSSTTGGEKILFEGNDGYRTSKYTLRDLKTLTEQQQKHERELKQLREENRKKIVRSMN
ncbi:hypothetical protein GGER_52590 [Serratia rubidaea]